MTLMLLSTYKFGTQCEWQQRIKSQKVHVTKTQKVQVTNNEIKFTQNSMISGQIVQPTFYSKEHPVS